MQEPQRLHDLFRDVDKKDQKGSANPEREMNRYYQLIHMKLSPKRLSRLSAVNVAILAGVLVFFTLASFLMSKPVESRIEKRELAQKPELTVQSLFTGSFSRDFETYFADTFPMRDAMVGLSAVLDEGRGVRHGDVRIVAPQGGGESQDLKASDQSPQNPQSPLESGPVTPGQSDGGVPDGPGSQVAPSITDGQPVTDGVISSPIYNGTFVYNGMAMSLFGGSAQSASWYADVLNTYKDELPGVQIYNMIIPTAVEFYVPDAYRDMTQSQKKIIDQVYGELDPSIKKVDAYSALQEHTNEYLYFRTDHHWTGLGAYYAYTAFCAQAGLTPRTLSEFETRRLDGFIGTMYAESRQDRTLLENPDYVDYYLFNQDYTAQRYDKGSPRYGVSHTLWGEYAKSPNSYSVFLHGDFPMIEVKTGIQNGRKIMMVKESFGNAFAPFLVNHYEEVYIVDQRYFELAAVDFIKEKGITELLFANNTFAVCTPYHIRCIDGMRHHTYYFYTPPQPAAPATPSEEDSSEPLEDSKGEDVEEKSAKKTSKKKAGQSQFGEGLKLNPSAADEEDS